MIYKDRIFFSNYRFKDWWIVLIAFGRRRIGIFRYVVAIIINESNIVVLKEEIKYNYNFFEIIEIN